MDSFIYILYKIRIFDGEKKNELNAEKTRFGVFDSMFAVQRFIVQHNHDNNCFFIAYTYVLNPIHSNQAFDNVTVLTFDTAGKIMCNCNTHKINIHYNELHSIEHMQFKGRHTDILKNDYVWYYDDYDKTMHLATVMECPYNETEVKQHIEKYGENLLEWYDDSFMLMPVGIVDNHQHVLSCFVFTVDFIKTLLS